MQVHTSEYGGNSQSVSLSTTPEEIEKNTGMATGYEVATIEVTHLDGQITRFFVVLQVNKQGRIVAEIATNTKDNKTRAHRIVGTKWPSAYPRGWDKV